MEWKKSFEKEKEIIFVTSSKDGRPNANVVISLGFMDDKLVIADCQMKISNKNLDENVLVCVLSRDDNYIRLSGRAIIEKSGKYYDLAKECEDAEFPVNSAIAIEIEEVFDLDKCEKIEK